MNLSPAPILLAYYVLWSFDTNTSGRQQYDKTNSFSRGSVENGAQNEAHNDFFSWLASKIFFSTKIVILTLLHAQSNAMK